MQTRTLLLDLDGTLVDPRVGIYASHRHAMAVLGRPRPDDATLAALVGPPLHDGIATLLGTDDRGLIERGVALYREAFAELGIDGNTVYPGVHQALARLSKAGVGLYLATSKLQSFARQIVERHGLAQYLRAVHGAEPDGRLGDKTALIGHLLDCERLPAGACAMVGDRRHDALGARANGVRAIGVLWGFGSRAELLAAGVDRLLATPAELATLVTVEPG